MAKFSSDDEYVQPCLSKPTSKGELLKHKLPSASTMRTCMVALCSLGMMATISGSATAQELTQAQLTQGPSLEELLPSEVEFSFEITPAALEEGQLEEPRYIEPSPEATLWYGPNEVDPRVAELLNSEDGFVEEELAFYSPEELQEMFEQAARELEVNFDDADVIATTPLDPSQDPASVPEDHDIPPCAATCSNTVSCNTSCWVEWDTAGVEDVVDVTAPAPELGGLIQTQPPKRRVTSCGSYGVCHSPPHPPVMKSLSTHNRQTPALALLHASSCGMPTAM